MSNDFGKDFAEDLTDYLSQGTNLPTAPGTVYITLYDDTGAELNSSLQNGRVAVTTGTGFNEPTTTSFENANEIDFGEATSDITIQEAAIKAGDAIDGNTTVYARADVTNAPQSFTTNTRVFYSAGELTFDVLEHN